MEFCDPYGWHATTAEDFGEIRTVLADLETITWGEIFGKRSRLHHYCPANKFSAAARARLRDIGLDDLGRLFRLRITAVKRLWGLIDESDGTFSALWWDPLHRVYPYELPNT